MLRPLGRAFALLLCLLLGTPAYAQLEDAPDRTIIVVVDLQRILREAQAVQTLQQQVGAAREAFQAEIRQREEELRRLDQELARERPDLPPEIYAERRQELADRLANLQSDVQERRRQLDQAMNEGMRQIQSVLLPILQAITEERGADLLLAKSAIVLVRPEFEITDEALGRLDTALPTVTALPSN